MNTAFEKKLKKIIRNIADFPKPGVLFKDITPLLADAGLYTQTIDALVAPYLKKKINYVVGIEARGFLLAAAAAYKLKAGLVPVRKKGKLPHKTVSVTYDLEYGKDTLEIHEDAFGKPARVLIVDDVLATGGTAGAAAQLVEMGGGKVLGYSFLIELEALGGRSKLNGYPINVLLKF